MQIIQIFFAKMKIFLNFLQEFKSYFWKFHTEATERTERLWLVTVALLSDYFCFSKLSFRGELNSAFSCCGWRANRTIA
jgi:hypothetical protein